MKFNFDRTLLYLITFAYFIIGNTFYGWNAFPKSSDELLFDGILIVAIMMCRKEVPHGA